MFVCHIMLFVLHLCAEKYQRWLKLFDKILTKTWCKSDAHLCKCNIDNFDFEIRIKLWSK